MVGAEGPDPCIAGLLKVSGRALLGPGHAPSHRGDDQRQPGSPPVRGQATRHEENG